MDETIIKFCAAHSDCGIIAGNEYSLFITARNRICEDVHMNIREQVQYEYEDKVRVLNQIFDAVELQTSHQLEEMDKV